MPVTSTEVKWESVDIYRYILNDHVPVFRFKEQLNKNNFFF